MRDDLTRTSLLARLRDPGDDAAWREFDDLYGELILRYCHTRGLQLFDAEDVRQQVMISLARVMPTFQYDRQRGRFRSYVGVIARRAIDRVRTREASAGAIATEAGLERGEVDAPADEDWEREWVLQHCRRALDSLRQSHDPRGLAVFERLLAGRGIAEVAAEFDMTPEAVRKVKQRVRDRLRDLVDQQLRLEEGGDSDD